MNASCPHHRLLPPLLQLLLLCQHQPQLLPNQKEELVVPWRVRGGAVSPYMAMVFSEAVNNYKSIVNCDRLLDIYLILNIFRWWIWDECCGGLEFHVKPMVMDEVQWVMVWWEVKVVLMVVWWTWRVGEAGDCGYSKAIHTMSPDNLGLQPGCLGIYFSYWTFLLIPRFLLVAIFPHFFGAGFSLDVLGLFISYWVYILGYFSLPFGYFSCTCFSSQQPQFSDLHGEGKRGKIHI